MNIYSDAFHSALKYLKDTEVNINNLIIMTGDFNIRDSLWNPSFPHHSSISNDLFILVDSFNLDLSTPTNPIPTRYSDTSRESDSVIDLMFCYIQVHLSENNIPAVKPLLNHISPPSTAATFLATCLRAVLQPSGYSVFHGGDTPIQLSLPWRSCSCQCLNTETSAWSNRGFTTETPSISYNIHLYIRLVVTL